MMLILLLIWATHAETIALTSLRIPKDPASAVHLSLDQPGQAPGEDQTGELGFYLLYRFSTDAKAAALKNPREATQTIPDWPRLMMAYQRLARRIATTSARPRLRAEAAALLENKAWQTPNESYGDVSKHFARVLERLTAPLKNPRGRVHPTLRQIAGGRDYMVPARWSARGHVDLVMKKDALEVER